MPYREKISIVGQRTRRQSLVVGVAGPESESPNLYVEESPTLGCVPEDGQDAPGTDRNEDRKIDHVDHGVLGRPSAPGRYLETFAVSSSPRHTREVLV